MSGNPTTGRELGVNSLIDLCANAVDQAFGDRIIVVAAMFTMGSGGCSDVIPGCLIHGVTMHRK